MHTPKQSFYILSAILAVLGGIMLVFPDKGISLGENFTIRFLTLNEFIPSEENEYADISHLIAESSITEEDTLEQFSLDTVIEETTIQVIDTVRANASKLKNLTYKIQFKDNDPTILYPFFEALKSYNKDSSIVRIMHYGDSQIEGDRITSILRNNLQNEFGGYGVGLLSAYEENGYAAQLKVQHTGAWERHTRYGLKDSLVNHNKYGALLNFCRFSPIPQEGDEIDTTLKTASLKISKKKDDFYRKRKFKTCRVFYGNSTTEVFIEFIHKDSTVMLAGGVPGDGVKMAEVTLKDFTDEIEIKFTSKQSPDIYGISLEGDRGVVVDNIPLRGSSGLEFTRTRTATLVSMYKHIKPELILLEFGVNVVPNIVDDYTFYKKGFIRQIEKIQGMLPHVPIIIIGVSDMSRKSGIYYESYPNIEKIRDVQKQAAFETGCAFWDMYSAMGGKNSMPSWVFAKPPLAQKDFTHFNHRGSKIVADMFFNAFHYEYQEWEQHMLPRMKELEKPEAVPAQDSSIIEANKAKQELTDTVNNAIN